MYSEHVRYVINIFIPLLVTFDETDWLKAMGYVDPLIEVFSLEQVAA